MGGQKRRIKKHENQKKDRWGNRLAIIGATIVVFSLGIVVNIKSVSLKKKDQEYQQKEAALERLVQQEKERTDELEQYREYVQSKQYIEEIAKQKLGLVKPDEILLKPVPGN